jgi:diguanylate cyclase (GGDEF)-like protein/PAS domain S-box-containing protein
MELERSYQRELLNYLYEGVYFVKRDLKITFWNKAAAKITGYGPEEVLGKYCNEVSVAHIDTRGSNMCIRGLCPLGKAISQGRVCEEDGYLLHKNGRRVSVSMRIIPQMDADGRFTGTLQVFRSNSKEEEIKAKLEKLQKLALSDTMTELGNRRYAENKLEEKLAEMHRYSHPFGVIYTDVDGFKKINDTYGHGTGDQALKTISKSMLSSVRSFDAICRWGGEEFLGIIMNVDQEQLQSIAERMRSLVERSSFTAQERTVNTTISIGATLAKDLDTPDTLLRRADHKMYECKALGGNRVCIE